VTLGEDGSGLPAAETSGYARAVLTMLEDLSGERERMGDGQRALVNILEDSFEERTRLQDTQAAVLNILEDLQGEQEEIRRLNAQLEDRVREGTEDLLQRTAELKAANQELEAFAYSLAHDLRTPIRAISAFGAVLARNHSDQLGDQGRETLERIRRASTRMGELIDAMLLLAQLTRRELSFTSVDLSAAAREVSEELRAVDPARRVEFVIEDGLETLGDQRLVRVLIRNLLGNAWKFTSPREHARIEVTRAGAGVFAVRDNGVGFNMDFAGLLFKPFARLHGEDEFPGIGVGLTTAERIVRRHGGAVWGESRPGEGATFYFKLEPPTETGS
jgi:light-regulated signal transduction histidine kinase (bacteriophytochrome)